MLKSGNTDLKKSSKSFSKVLHIVKSFNFLPVVVSELSALEIYHIQSYLKTLSAYSSPPERFEQLWFKAFDISHQALLICKKTENRRPHFPLCVWTDMEWSKWLIFWYVIPTTFDFLSIRFDPSLSPFI